jgi:tRNA pseudouridine55 synthase
MLNEQALKESLEQFKGTISQRPPAYSAISVGGEKLYKKARRGENVDVPLRQVHVSEISLLDVTSDTCRLRIRCSKGTYIRSLARDLGEAMGGAAFCSALRRTAVGEFSVTDALQIGSEPEMLHASLLTGLSAKVGLPHVQLQKQEAIDLSHGKKVTTRSDVQIKPGEVALAFYGDEIWAIVAEHQGEIIVKRGFGKQL